MPEEEVGFVEHWFGNVGVAAIKVTNGKIKVGDTLHFKGHTSDFQEPVASIQIEHKSVPEAKKGDDIGIKVSQKAHEHDKVFKVVP
ncbi:MAG: translation elongation factor-like protein [Deltaproteobacteria bacterium]|nr:translation elongation factor-like protein [Deltaproteobacteria bacterium]